MAEEKTTTKPETLAEGGLARLGLGLANWSERWFPDALVFALLGIVIVFIIGLLIGEKPYKLALEGGKQFWVLIPFTMQMAMIIIGGYLVASTPAAVLDNSASRIGSINSQRCDCICRFLLDVHLSDLVGIQPNFQRSIGTRTRQAN